LPGALSFDLGLLGERRLDRAMDRTRIAACGSDQVGRETFRIVEQHFQQMVRQKTLVTLTQRQHLRALKETAHTLGVLLLVHLSTLSFRAPFTGGRKSGPSQEASCRRYGEGSGLRKTGPVVWLFPVTWPGYKRRVGFDGESQWPKALNSRA
jgi:hypothetical protein